MTAADVAGPESDAGDLSNGAGDRIDVSTAAALARSLTDLLRASHQMVMSQVSPVAVRVSAHLGCALDAVASVGETFPLWEQVNLQRGIDAYLTAQPGETEWFGVRSGHGHEDLATMLTAPGPGGQVTAVAHGTAAIGPDAVMEVVLAGAVLSQAPDGTPVVIGMQVTEQFGPAECRVDVLAARHEAAVAVRDEIGRLMRARDVLRGQVLSFGASEHRGNELLTFLPRPELTAEQVILPAGVLDSIERHVISVTSHAEQLRAVGQHLKRGLLLHGLPGTGKTHTVRYLMSRMRDCTVVVLTGHAMHYLESAAALARRLQPSMLILEDVDLVALDRDFSDDGNPMLFSLLDAMDGIGADADVTFVLTTNRVAVLERALAQRPGRVDLAVEIPLPGAQDRERLLRLYSGSMRLDADLAPVVEATEGVTASYIKELLRRAVLAAFRVSADARSLTDADLAAAVGELSAERQALTRSLIGQPRPGDPDEWPDLDDEDEGEVD